MTNNFVVFLLVLAISCCKSTRQDITFGFAHYFSNLTLQTLDSMSELCLFCKRLLQKLSYVASLAIYDDSNFPLCPCYQFHFDQTDLPAKISLIQCFEAFSQELVIRSIVHSFLADCCPVGDYLILQQELESGRIQQSNHQVPLVQFIDIAKFLVVVMTDELSE